MAKSKKVARVTHKVVKKFMKKSAKHRAKAAAYQQRQEIVRKQVMTKELISKMDKVDPASTICLAMGCNKPGKELTHNGLFCKPHAKKMREIRSRLRDAKLSGDVAAEARWRRREVAFRKDADLGHIHAWTMREVEAAQIAAESERAGLGYPSEQQVAAAVGPPSKEELAALHDSARQVQAVFLAAAAEPAAGSPVRRQYGPSAPADAVAGQTLLATPPQPAQLAPSAALLSALLPSPFVLQPTPMPSRALELARLHQAWQQKHVFNRMPLHQYLNGRWAGPVWVPQRDVPGGGRDAVSAAAPVQTGSEAATAAPASEHVQPARRTSADAASAAASEQQPNADDEPAPSRSTHGDRQERQRAGRQAQLLAKLKSKETKSQRLKRHEKPALRMVKQAAAQQQQQSARQRADDGTTASADDDATDTDASKLPRALQSGQPVELSRFLLAQQPAAGSVAAAGSAAAEPVQHEQPAALPTYDLRQDVDSPHPAPAAAVTDAAGQDFAPESGELVACCDVWNAAPHACGDSAPRLTRKAGHDAQPRTSKQAPLLLKPKKRNLTKAQRFKRRLEMLALRAAEREAAQQKRRAAEQRADDGFAAAADDDATGTDDSTNTARSLLPRQPSASSRSLLLGQQPAAGSAAAKPAQAKQPVSLPIYDPWQDADSHHPAPQLPHTSASVEPVAAAQDAPAYDPWEEAESSQGLQLPTTVEQWSPIVHRDGERVDPLAQTAALLATPLHTGAAPAATGRRSASTAAAGAAPAGARSQQQPGQASAAAAGYDPWEAEVSDAVQLAAKASSPNGQPVQPSEKQPSAAVADYDPWVDVEA